MEAVLRSSKNEPVSLSKFRGKPVILFFEDRKSTFQNEALKKDLFERGKARGLLNAAHVVAVADLKGYDFFPARIFALGAVRDVEKKFGIPVLVDWKRVLCAPPFKLPAETSSVMVLDPRGEPVFLRSGTLGADDKSALFAALAAQLGVDLNDAAKDRSSP